jgi:hypothetical protein
VGDLLGDLALDDEPHERLRVHLQAFLSYGDLQPRPAAQLGLSTRTRWQYRVRKAVELLGEPLETHHQPTLSSPSGPASTWGRAMLAPPSSDLIDPPPPFFRPGSAESHNNLAAANAQGDNEARDSGGRSLSPPTSSADAGAAHS